MVAGANKGFAGATGENKKNKEKVCTEQLRIDRFYWGLRPELRVVLAAAEPQTYASAILKALSTERAEQADRPSGTAQQSQQTQSGESRRVGLDSRRGGWSRRFE